MKKSTLRSIFKLFAVVFSILSICVIDAAVSGSLSLIAAIALTSAFAYIAANCFSLSIKRPAKKTKPNPNVYLNINAYNEEQDTTHYPVA